MITAQDMAKAFERNVRIAQQQTEGLSHADCLLQPPFQGNCMNWVLGHVTDTRNSVLTHLGLAPILSEAQANRYGYGSEPVCADGADLVPLGEMLAKLVASQAAIETRLAEITPEELAVETESHLGTTSLGAYLFFLYWHETYHVGQTELLRQLAGVGDKVV